MQVTDSHMMNDTSLKWDKMDSSCLLSTTNGKEISILLGLPLSDHLSLPELLTTKLTTKIVTLIIKLQKCYLSLSFL